MQYKLTIKWNGSRVMRAYCTTAMAFENLRLCAQQFSSAEKAGLVLPTLDAMLDATAGTVFEGRGDDETGVIEFHALAEA